MNSVMKEFDCEQKLKPCIEIFLKNFSIYFECDKAYLGNFSVWEEMIKLFVLSKSICGKRLHWTYVYLQ